jgi:cyclophilin family peptidyl-prolyl cis-trans isomerase
VRTRDCSGGLRGARATWGRVKAAIIVCSSLLVTCGGCSRQRSDQLDSGASTDSGRVQSLFEAEVSRDASTVTAADLSSRDVRVRRSAVRALARISNRASQALLERSLADEDSEVVAWAAFGLGRICTSGDAEATIRRIVVRAATWLLKLGPGSSRLPSSRLDPWFAFAQSIGRCATPESERVLRSWMSVSSEVARAAVQGLDYYVQSTKNLDASTIVALLDAAEKDRALVVALLPVSRLSRLDPLVGRRLVALAPRLLETAGDERRFLLRALPLAGESAIPILERVVVDDGHYQPLERVEALRAIGKMGATGQEVLARLVSRTASLDSTPSEALLLSSKWSLLSEMFEQLKEAPKSARAPLSRLATLEVAEGKQAAAIRRISYLRCRSAALLTAEDIFGPLVEHCDVSQDQREKKLAQLAIMDRLKLRGRQVSAFESLAADRDPVVAMAAIGLLSTHDELNTGSNYVVAALGAESMGIVATAARLLADHPQRTKRSRQAIAELATALDRAMSKNWPVDAVEVRVALIDAAAELGFLSAKPKIMTECSSVVPVIRQHAEQALKRLGDPKQLCVQPTKLDLPKETGHVVSKPLTLRFHTDVGPLEIRLDSNLAPVAVTRLVDLAEAGFYDGIVVHRVVSGFVVQLGDRSSDGYGGAGRPPLPCELSPEPFGPSDVGMALSGSDSGSSQFFVTLGPYPQLGGDYSRVGRAGAGWDQLFVGDRIHKVEVVP